MDDFGNPPNASHEFSFAFSTAAGSAFALVIDQTFNKDNPNNQNAENVLTSGIANVKAKDTGNGGHGTDLRHLV
jgi:hypothetical protein